MGAWSEWGGAAGAAGQDRREITQQRTRRGVFTSVKQLKVAIYDYIAENNEHAQAFAWTATPDDILAKVRRARAPLHKTPTA